MNGLTLILKKMNSLKNNVKHVRPPFTNESLGKKEKNKKISRIKYGYTGTVWYFKNSKDINGQISLVIRCHCSPNFHIRRKAMGFAVFELA